jgi:hypothetical protein
VRFVVDKRRIVDAEVRPPYNWLLRWEAKPNLEGRAGRPEILELSDRG